MLKEIQSILDAVLLPCSILAHHLRRIDVDEYKGGEIDKEKYVVYRRVTSTNRIYGNGNKKLRRTVVDVNLYYARGLEALEDYDEATVIIDDIEKAFIAAGWRTSGQTDLFDMDIGLNGINIEVSCIA